MRIYHIAILFTVALVSIYSSCTKKDLLDENNKWVYPDDQNVGYVKIMHNYSGKTPALPSATSPAMFFYANGAKLNGTSLGYPAVWPATSVYGDIQAGPTTFTGVLARMNTTVVPNVPAPIAGDTVVTFNINIEKGKFYSVYLVDTTPTIRAVIKEENFTVPAAGSYKIRLANFISNPLDTFNLYSRNGRVNLVSNVAHKQISDFIELPLNTINDTLEIRKPGGTAPLYYVGGGVSVVTTPQPFFPIGQRIYTIVVRGKTSSTPNNVPSANLVINR